jgi:hypothetical protein
MQFKEIRCPIPRLQRLAGGIGKVIPCGRYLVDIEANAPVTIRCRCKNDHAHGHSCQSEFTQDENGIITYREIKQPIGSKTYNDNGVRLPMTREEATA